MNVNTSLVYRYLNYLELDIHVPTLDYLHELIKTHQTKVRWENITKIIDTEKGERESSGFYLPSIEDYIDRMDNDGMGGTCWTLAIGFHWLLSKLGFEASYMYMDSGHLCLRVELDQPYYVDVGYCAPLFQAYPIYESFRVEDTREVFQYDVNQSGITIIREPGPTKLLNPDPILLEDVYPIIARSNMWKTSNPLKNIMVFGYISGIPTSLTNNQLKQYKNDQKVERILTSDEIHYWIKEKFNMNVDMYKKALEIYKQKSNK